ncbi:DUF4279 domain-containing protein [Thalassotalea nanhaiensis]|uniref:DUF4279 domain-containing protein n=1 Tax=Thalassotalea nanhaiensis TaxID=3065648 RepID=A0ABY9THV0_9GAMM|nr:DUF4279 domain-containing protein [Colwelliaceae bacterium SQ345]
MAVISKTKLSLRVIGDELIPDEVSNLLGCEPTIERRKGEPFSWNKQLEQHRLAKSGMWRLEAKDKIPGNINEQISELLIQTSSDMDVWRSLSEKYTIDLFCGFFMESCMEGISLSSQSIKDLADRFIEIEFDIYGPDDE